MNTDDQREGDDDEEAWSNGITEMKYFGQIYVDIWRHEESNASLKVQSFRFDESR